MSQDIIADVLNQIMNRKKAGYKDVSVKKYSKLLIKILDIAKKEGYVDDYTISGRALNISFDLNECKSIKPRYTVNAKFIDKYIRRFLPSRNLGILLISTSMGLLTHREAIEKNVGGHLIAYFF